MPFVLLGAFAVPLTAQESVTPAVVSDEASTDTEEVAPLVVEAAEQELSDFQWLKRPVVIFADSPADPRFVEQLALINARSDALLERDVVVLTDTDPAARGPIRKAMRPRGFMLMVLAKDGSIVIRKARPWDVREISRNIDKLPLRQQEIREAHATAE